MGDRVAKKFLVDGTVQGVGYRDFACRAAERLDLVGYVKNQRGGRVEAVAEGPREAVAAFRARLEEGPPFSEVTGVEEIEVAPTGSYTSFRIE